MTATLDAHRRLMDRFQLLRELLIESAATPAVKQMTAAALADTLMAALDFASTRHAAALEARRESTWDRAARAVADRITPPRGTPVVSCGVHVTGQVVDGQLVSHRCVRPIGHEGPCSLVRLPVDAAGVVSLDLSDCDDNEDAPP